MDRHYYIYILTNKNNTTLYTGVTNDLIRRVHEHKNKMVKGFSKKYNLNKLVYYEVCKDVLSAINREKQIKSGSRNKKVDLVSCMNPGWEDLYYKLL